MYEACCWNDGDTPPRSYRGHARGPEAADVASARDPWADDPTCACVSPQDPIRYKNGGTRAAMFWMPPEPDSIN